MTELSRQALGAAVQRARQDSGLTQEDLGAKTGLGQTIISRIESAARKVDLIELVRIASALQITVDDLLSEASAATGPEADLIDAKEPARLVALRLGDAEVAEEVRLALSWIPDFVENLRRLEALDRDSPA